MSGTHVRILASMANSKISWHSWNISCLRVRFLTGSSPYLTMNFYRMWQLYASTESTSPRHTKTSFCTWYSGLMNGASFSAKLMVSTRAT